MIKKIALSVFFLLALTLFSQEEIEYENKYISKEINKIFEKENYTLNEISTNEKFNGKFFTILEFENLIGYTYVGRVNSCRAGGCSINNSERHNDFEYFDYFILLDDNFTVKKVKVFNYQATHGQEICSKNWLKQFIGFKGNDNLVVGKNIDAIAGATISTHAISFDIEEKTAILKELISM